MFCVHCGKEIQTGAGFCAFCGKPQQITPVPQAYPEQQASQPPQASQAQQPHPGQQQALPAPMPHQKKSRRGLVIGLIAGGVLLVLAVVLLLVFLLRDDNDSAIVGSYYAVSGTDDGKPVEAWELSDMSLTLYADHTGYMYLSDNDSFEIMEWELSGSRVTMRVRHVGRNKPETYTFDGTWDNGVLHAGYTGDFMIEFRKR